MNEQVENANASLELVTPNSDLAQKLKCTTNTKVYKVHRKKMLHKKILCIETSYYNSQLVPF
ncbi:UTRA domain-containing protein [Lactobacillus sp. R2/2]|nr:UTRA domain-containing protein [Lactobacillus sp. R2/2]